MMFATLNMFLGCNDSKDITSPKSFEEPLEYVQTNSGQEVFDFTSCNGSNYHIINPDVKFYSSGFDPNNRIYQVFYKNGVQNQIQYFEEQGYEFRPEHSLVIKGKVVPEGLTDTFEVEVVELVMAYIEDTMKQVVHVSYTECDKLGYAIQSSITSFVPPEDIDSYNEILLGQDANQNNVFVWVKDFEPNIAYKATPSIATFTWQDYKACVLSWTAGGCAAAAVACAFSGPGYGACVAVGCTAAFVAGVVGCAVLLLFP